MESGIMKSSGSTIQSKRQFRRKDLHYLLEKKQEVAVKFENENNE